MKSPSRRSSVTLPALPVDKSLSISRKGPDRRLVVTLDLRLVNAKGRLRALCAVLRLMVALLTRAADEIVFGQVRGSCNLGFLDLGTRFPDRLPPARRAGVGRAAHFSELLERQGIGVLVALDVVSQAPRDGRQIAVYLP